MRRFLVIAEDFYRNPYALRKKALEYFLEKGKEYEPLLDEIVRDRFEELIGKEITKGKEIMSNSRSQGVFSIFHLKQRAEKHFGMPIHTDFGAYEYSGIVYMTPYAPLDSGTSFWQHNETGLISYPTPSDSEKLKMPMKDLIELLNKDSYSRKKWNEIDRVANRFNRALVFRGGRFHSTSRVFGSNAMNGRMIQIFNFSTR